MSGQHYLSTEGYLPIISLHIYWGEQQSLVPGHRRIGPDHVPGEGDGWSKLHWLTGFHGNTSAPWRQWDIHYHGLFMTNKSLSDLIKCEMKRREDKGIAMACKHPHALSEVKKGRLHGPGIRGQGEREREGGRAGKTDREAYINK